MEEDQNTPGEVQEGVSITRNGLHEVYRERPVGWWEGDLGRIYRPKYFSGGQAVHGSNNVPNYPASHGCVRVSIPAMDFIWDSGLMPLHTPGVGPRRQLIAAAPTPPHRVRHGRRRTRRRVPLLLAPAEHAARGRRS